MKLPRLTVIAVALCAAVLGLASSAGAATVVVGEVRGGVEFPRLTSDGAVWLSALATGGDASSTRLLRGRPGRRVTRIATLGGADSGVPGFGGDGPYGYGANVTGLTVSGERIAFSDVSYDSDKGRVTGNATTGTSANIVNLATRSLLDFRILRGPRGIGWDGGVRLGRLPV